MSEPIFTSDLTMEQIEKNSVFGSAQLLCQINRFS